MPLAGDAPAAPLQPRPSCSSPPLGASRPRKGGAGRCGRRQAPMLRLGRHGARGGSHGLAPGRLQARLSSCAAGNGAGRCKLGARLAPGRSPPPTPPTSLAGARWRPCVVVVMQAATDN